MSTLTSPTCFCYRKASLLIFLYCWLGTANAAVTDLFLVLERDGLSYTLQQTVHAENERVVIELPGSVVPLHVQMLNTEPTASGLTAQDRIEFTTGTAIVRYQHQFGDGLQRDELGHFSLSMSSIPANTTLPADATLAQSVTWVFPAGVRIKSYTADTDAVEWTLENNVLQFRSDATDVVKITLDYYWPDTDQDGIPDAVGFVDLCNETPSGFPVDSSGCALDTDADTVADGMDRCPETPAGEPVDATGCGVDFDSDGVPNHADHCRNTPQDVSVDAQGCPADIDRDGVDDSQDQCPGTPDSVVVDQLGCAPDTDGDSIPDYRDLCPDSNGRSGALGCHHSDRNLVVQGVTFSTGSSFLSAETRLILDKVAAAMNHLENENFEVGAHTDDQGTRKNNRALSSRRASSVRRYLMLRGVSANRITAKGYGEARPLVPNRSLEARKKNRRIEISLR